LIDSSIHSERYLYYFEYILAYFIIPYNESENIISIIESTSFFCLIMSPTSSSSNEDTNLSDDSSTTTAQQDSGQSTVAGQGYDALNSKSKSTKKQRQQQENEQPANQE
jgi:hypothetical protein